MLVKSRTRAVLIPALLVIAAALSPFAARAADRSAELKKLHWVTGTVHLSTSSASVIVPPAMHMVKDADAKRLDFLINGISNDSPPEAIAIDSRNGETTYYEYQDSGYVTADDWKDVDAAQMLQQLKDNTEASNADRVAQGVSKLHLVGWMQQPQYEKKTGTVRWALRAHDEKGGDLVNAIALRLGRRGYEKITWVAPLDSYQHAHTALDAMVANYHFGQGARYKDYLSGDKLAGYGVAALVGTVAGVSLVKTGIGLAILLALKKFLLVIVALALGGFRWIKSRFARTPPAQFSAEREPPAQAPPAS